MTGPGLLASTPPSQTDPNQFGPMVVSQGVNTEDLARSANHRLSERAEFEFATKGEPHHERSAEGVLHRRCRGQDDRSALKWANRSPPTSSPTTARAPHAERSRLDPASSRTTVARKRRTRRRVGKHCNRRRPVDPSETDTSA